MTKLQILTHLRSSLDDLSFEFIWPERLKEMNRFVNAQLDEAEVEACAPSSASKFQVLDGGCTIATPLGMIFADLPPGSSLTLHRGPDA